MAASPARRRNTVLNLAFGYATTAVTLIRNIVLVPVYLAFIDFDLYGAWLATGAVLTQVVVSDFGLAASIIQRVSEALGTRDSARIERAVGTSLGCAVLITAALTVLGLLLTPIVTNLVDTTPGQGDTLRACVTIAVLSSCLGVLGIVLVGMLRSLQRPATAGLIVLVADVVGILGTIIMLERGAGLYALAWGLAARALVLVTIASGSMFYVCTKTLAIKLTTSVNEIKALLSASLNVFVSSIATKLEGRADTFFVGAFLGSEAAGIYGLTIRAQETLWLLLGQIFGALAPSLAHLHGENDRDRFAAVFLRIFLLIVPLGCVGFAMVMAFNEQFVTLWVGAEFFAGTRVTYIYALAGIISLAGYSFSNFVVARGEFGLYRRVFVAASALHIGVLFPLLTFGLTGAAAAALLSTTVWTLMFAFAVIRRFGPSRSQVQLLTRTFVLSAACAVTLAALSALFNMPIRWHTFLLGAGVMGLCVLGVIVTLDARVRQVLIDEGRATMRMRRGSIS